MKHEFGPWTCTKEQPYIEWDLGEALQAPFRLSLTVRA